MTMAITKSFKELVQSRVARDPEFGAALLREGIDTMLDILGSEVPLCRRNWITSPRRSASSRVLKK